MIEVIGKAWTQGFDKNTLTLEIPANFEQLKAVKKDVNFEFSSSQSLQPLQLGYCSDISAYSIAVILVTTQL